MRIGKPLGQRLREPVRSTPHPPPGAGLENIANLERVSRVGAWVIALPMKIAGGTGGPLRIVAIFPR